MVTGRFVLLIMSGALLYPLGLQPPPNTRASASSSRSTSGLPPRHLRDRSRSFSLQDHNRPG